MNRETVTILIHPFVLLQLVQRFEILTADRVHVSHNEAGYEVIEVRGVPE